VDSIQRDSVLSFYMASPDGVQRQCPKILLLVYQELGTTFRQPWDAPKCKFRDSKQPLLEGNLNTWVQLNGCILAVVSGLLCYVG
jgi:hypothetical protein